MKDIIICLAVLAMMLVLFVIILKINICDLFKDLHTNNIDKFTNDLLLVVLLIIASTVTAYAMFNLPQLLI